MLIPNSIYLFILSILLIGCSNGGSSSTGSGRAPIFSVEVDNARKAIRPYYPEASYMPAVFSGEFQQYWAWYKNGIIYLGQKWLLAAQDGNWRTACTLVHEWWHSKQVPAYKDTPLFKANELDAQRVDDECQRKIR